MKYFPKIPGERVYLSPMNPEDLEKYTSWLNDNKITDRLGNTTKIITLEKEKEMLADMVKDGYNFAVVLSPDNELIGNASLFDINHIHRSATCGLFIGDEKNRGKGYGSEALSLLLGYGFKYLNLNNVMLKVFAFNTEAISCYKKLGFSVIGERRNSYFLNGRYYNDVFMDITAEDFFGGK